jgi:hypothetical protein
MQREIEGKQARELASKRSEPVPSVMSRFRSLCLLVILPAYAAMAAELPSGTALSVRQHGSVGTRFSKVGDPVSAVLLSPVLQQRRVILPAGSELEGTVTMVSKMGLGFRRQAASMSLAFHSIRLPNGRSVPIEARVKRVENARERVDADGRIQGIGPVTNVSSSLAVAAWRLLVIAPGVGVPVWVTKLIFAPPPDTEIVFARGTEYRLEVLQPVMLDDADIDFAGLPTAALSPKIRSDARAAMDALPSQRVKHGSGRPADLVNLILVGSAGSVARAFQAAGWTTSDVKTAGSVLHTYFSIVMRRGYKKAPMVSMFLDGNRSDIELQKSLNTFARRHHIRIWQRPWGTDGESVWVAAATEDTGIQFSRRAWTFTHAIDAYVDAERTKVVDDLLYTGCATEAGLIERKDLPANLENGTGTKLKTDGSVAVVRISECAQPRLMPGVGLNERKRPFRAFALSMRSELIRSNFLSLAYNGVRLSSATRRFFFGKPLLDDTGATLTRQQVEWLADQAPGAENLSVREAMSDAAQLRSSGEPAAGEKRQSQDH